MNLLFSRNPNPHLAVAVARHLGSQREPKGTEAVKQSNCFCPFYWKPDLPHVFVRRESTSAPAFVYNSH